MSKLRLKFSSLTQPRSRGMIILFSVSSFWILFKTQLATQGIGSFDDRCYLEYLYRYMALPPIGCQSSHYFPGTSLLWIPLGLFGKFISFLGLGSAQDWILALTGVSGFFYWAFTALIVERLLRDQIKLSTVWVVLFMLSLPILINVFAVPRSSHPPELFLSAIVILALMKSRYVIACMTLLVLLVTRPNTAPIFLLIWGKSLDDYLRARKMGTESKKEKRVLSILSAIAIPLAIAFFYVAFIGGYGGRTFVQKQLGYITPGIAWDYMFTAYDGFVWSHPWWTFVFVLGLSKLRRLSWMSRGGLIWMAAQLVMGIGWDADSEFMRLMSRYYLATYLAALLICLEVLRGHRGKLPTVFLVLLIWEATRNVLSFWGYSTRYVITVIDTIEGDWFIREWSEIPALFAGYVKLLGLSPGAFSLYSLFPDSKLWEYVGAPGSPPLSNAALLTVMSTGLLTLIVAFSVLRKLKQEGISSFRKQVTS